ncbi:MAG: AgmX/PglI C-terminal domain-containing protein, partial [bacterium]|nr:AgmX/PglI C-terminal domain-containing protein [bacterium]
MKKNLIFVFALILLAFSCSSTQKAAVKEQMYDGAVLFNSQKYTEAIKVFEKVLEKDPENANAAYNIAISYIQLKNDDKALIYLNKATDINKFYYDAWYNMSVINYNKGNYKEAVKSAIKGGKISENILEKAYKKLVEKGFPYRNYSQIKNKLVIPAPDFKVEATNFYLSISVKPDGKVNSVYLCSKNKTELCDFYTKIFSELEFIPGYNFYSDQFENSVVIAFVDITKERAVKVEFIGNEIYENSNNDPTMGSLDRSQIDAYIKRNLAKIRWCYEKALKKNSSLYGKIVINFIINGSGAVSLSKIHSSTMNNKNVETCVADQIKKIQFPAPKGGGIVIVNYPFVFK